MTSYSDANPGADWDVGSSDSRQPRYQVGAKETQDQGGGRVSILGGQPAQDAANTFLLEMSFVSKCTHSLHLSLKAQFVYGVHH